MNASIQQLGIDIATSSVAIATSAVTNFWPYILGLVIVMGVIYRFKRLGKAVR